MREIQIDIGVLGTDGTKLSFHPPVKTVTDCFPSAIHFLLGVGDEALDQLANFQGQLADFRAVLAEKFLNIRAHNTLLKKVPIRRCNLIHSPQPTIEQSQFLILNDRDKMVRSFRRSRDQLASRRNRDRQDILQTPRNWRTLARVISPVGEEKGGSRRDGLGA